MTREEYIIERAEINIKISHLQDKLTGMNKIYIKEHAGFDVGDRVRVISPGFEYFGKQTPEKIEYGYVYGFDLSAGGFVSIRLSKEKKNGTPSKFNNLFVGYGAKIEKA